MDERIKYGFIDRVGETFVTNEGYKVEIVEYFSFNNCTVQFENEISLYNKGYNEIKLGNIKNPYHPSVYGVGYVGQGKYSAMHKGVRSKCYITWQGILKRCYNKRGKEQNKSYEGANY